ncbi:hypothetical protein ACU4GD_24000 [Cupriavidus basilensis]
MSLLAYASFGLVYLVLYLGHGFLTPALLGDLNRVELEARRRTGGG